MSYYDTVLSLTVRGKCSLPIRQSNMSLARSAAQKSVLNARTLTTRNLLASGICNGLIGSGTGTRKMFQCALCVRPLSNVLRAATICHALSVCMNSAGYAIETPLETQIIGIHSHSTVAVLKCWTQS